MSKLLDMFAQARRVQSGGGMGFLGKSKPAIKPRAAALVVEFPTPDAGSAEAAVKAGANGLLFTWNGKGVLPYDELKQASEAALAVDEKAASGLHVVGGWDQLTRETLEKLQEHGIQYVI